MSHQAGVIRGQEGAYYGSHQNIPRTQDPAGYHGNPHTNNYAYQDNYEDSNRYKSMCTVC